MIANISNYFKISCTWKTTNTLNSLKAKSRLSLFKTCNVCLKVYHREMLPVVSFFGYVDIFYNWHSWNINVATISTHILVSVANIVPSSCDMHTTTLSMYYLNTLPI